jgi:hypothetical protein
MRCSSFQIITFIGLTASRKEKALHITMLYVRYVHLTKAKPIHKRQTRPLVREDITARVELQKKIAVREP